MNTNRHLIALDLDGTLLTDEKIISSRTKFAVSQAIKAGHIIVIATGRPHRSSISYYQELQLNTPMVNFNGAYTHHPRDKHWKTEHRPMPIKTAHQIIDACYELEVNNIFAEVLDHLYIDQYDDMMVNNFILTPENPFSIGKLRDKLQDDPTSILIHPKEDQIANLRNHLNDNHAELIEHRNWGAPFNTIEIIKKGMNKAVGLQKIAKHFGIPQGRIIAFGDQDNDLEMIDYAGTGVAMGNAIDELKTVAKFVTDTNEADGIGLFLEEYLKLEPERV